MRKFTLVILLAPLLASAQEGGVWQVRQMPSFVGHPMSPPFFGCPKNADSTGLWVREEAGLRLLSRKPTVFVFFDGTSLWKSEGNVTSVSRDGGKNFSQIPGQIWLTGGAELAGKVFFVGRLYSPNGVYDGRLWKYNPSTSGLDVLAQVYRPLGIAIGPHDSLWVVGEDGGAVFSKDGKRGRSFRTPPALGTIITGVVWAAPVMFFSCNGGPAPSPSGIATLHYPTGQWRFFQAAQMAVFSVPDSALADGVPRSSLLGLDRPTSPTVWGGKILVGGQDGRCVTVFNPVTQKFENDLPVPWTAPEGERTLGVRALAADKDGRLFISAEVARDGAPLSHKGTLYVWVPDSTGVVEPPAPQDSTGAEPPEGFVLRQNYPNPFNPETSIQYQLPTPGHVTLVVYSSLGQEVRRLVDRSQPAAYHVVVWDGRDDSGNLLPSGVYFYRIESGKFTAMKKMVMVR